LPYVNLALKVSPHEINLTELLFSTRLDCKSFSE